MARGDLTDEEWSLIEPHLPLGERGPIPDLRRQFNAVMWRFRTGSPWRDLPTEYGPWSSTYDRFRSWALSGVFEQLMQAMIAEAAARGQTELGLVSVDSTTARAHHHAAGMALDSELVELLEQAAEQEKGLRQRGKTPATATPMKTAETKGGGYDGGAGSG
ncbi:transposase [Nonomuraea roseoviolacea subsp. carminata]|uniref:Transposase n=1 Tax=Nonomuraea roseoviolacea subsp. carminata TaxID=160689 RepID=A0ABT1K8Y2_9ACTN|nr:transposase [Nonomuraea roseoviolacea subsp. carminata]MCP2350473.1 transposase [Nonomuraea roseoviolacea subsp. carminata]MCP2352718.1 transposase [Nonomuraea roseoviolacea subsp. carminata]